MPYRPLLCLLTLAISAAAQSPARSTEAAAVSLADRVGGMLHQPGLLPIDWDAKAGKLYLEVPLTAADKTRSADYLWTHSLPGGVGQNDLGLDRGQLGGVGEPGGPRLVHFERTGPKILLVQPNLEFRTASTDPAERKAVEQSFPSAVLAGFKVEAEAPDGTVLLDVTDLVLRDVHGVATALARAEQGTYKVDPLRSAIALENTKAFPKNIELEAMLTFTSEGGKPNLLRNVAPDVHAVTVHEHQSFLELPPPGFTPRAFTPRAGYFPESYREMNTPLGEPTEQQYILRHRLIKKDPNCKQSCAAVTPIHYYVDRGAPEPIRTALVEGARWWDTAFQAAGWAPGTFLVDPLPAEADPMDILYNMIQWVHRYNRGWSYGAALADPRTGEILKGNVTLGSLRGRQDYLIAEALLAPYPDGKASGPAHDPALAMVLQRIRQLSAHETGHTLGLAHNFAASAYPHADPDTTISVMDYPHPYIALGRNGVPDLSHAYPKGIGLWDKVAINYGYREFDRDGHPADDSAALDRILRDSEKSGLVYITDEDARPFDGAHPNAHLWDNGADPAVELDRILQVRSAALSRFGLDTIRNGTPVADMEDTLAPLYLLHRYQTEAAIKMIGGLDYRYQVRGDGQPGPSIVPVADQKRALASVLKTLSPATLTLPESLLAQLPPRPPGSPRSVESLPAHTGLTFDPVASAEAAADLTLAVLLDPARASRLVEYGTRVPDALTLQQAEEAVSHAAAERPADGQGLPQEVERAVEFRVLEAMLSLSVDPEASSQARAITRAHLVELHRQWTIMPADAAEAAHRAALLARIDQWQREPEKFVVAKPVKAPPGMPIGDGEESF